MPTRKRDWRRVLVYAGVFVPHWVSLELVLRSFGFSYQALTDRELESFDFSPSDRLFIFPAGHNFGPNPDNLLGGPKGSARLRQAIADGMNYLGICAGANAAAHRSWYPIDVSLRLADVRHRWPGEHGAGVQLLTMKLDPVLARTSGIQSGEVIVWYHNGPIWAQSRRSSFRILAAFAPTKEQREQTREHKLFRKHLAGAPAIVECRYGRGRVVLCAPHPEYGDGGLRDWQRRIRQWLEAGGFSDADGDPLLPGAPGHRALMADLGGTWLEPVRGSANWKLLRALLNGLL
jgi:glutamine amidotransferase-like uncharacterized protein